MAKYTLKVVKGILVALLLLIPVALLLAGLVWFIAGLIFRLSVPSYLELTRDIYIVIGSCEIAYELFVFGVGSISYLITARRLGVPFIDVYEAVADYKMHKEKNLSEWDKKWFEETLAVKRMSRLMAEAISNALHLD
jgi:hypothetical protein